MSEPEKMPVAVPKFASFKPKTAPPPDAEKDKSRHRGRDRDRSKDRRSEKDGDRDKHRSHGSGRDKDHAKNRDRDRERDRDRDRDRDRERDRDRTHRRDRDNKREESPSRHRHRSTRPDKESSRSRHSHTESRPSASTKPKPLAPKPIDISGQDFFVIDTKGDSLIHLGLDRHRIPNFGRQKRKYLLGTTARLYMHYDGPHEQFSLLQPGEYIGPPPLRNKKLTFSMTKPLKAATGKRLRDEGEDTDDIVYVSKRQRDSEDSSDDELEPDFRSITGKAKPRYYSDSEDESDSKMSDDAKPDESPLKTRSIELSRRVKTDPSDISAWIDLIDLQEDLLQAGISPDQEASDGHIRGTADITLSMIDKALKACSRPENHEALLLRQMFHGRKVWPPHVLRTRWANIASGDYGGLFALWMARVDYEMTEPAGFSYEAIRKIYVERVQLLIEKAQRYQKVQAGELYAEAVYVFLRMTRFMHDAGYRELAIAAWQALIELNFFQPAQSLGLDAFADFWESEVLRAGEQGAQGWSEYVARGDSGIVPEPKEAAEDRPPGGKHVYASWAANEARCSRDGRMPARTMDDGTGDDPLRLVMASDLENLLLQFPESRVAELQEQLVDALLIFSHLDPVFKSSPWTQRALHDPFLAPYDASFDRAVTNVYNGDAHGQVSEQPWFLRTSICPGVVPEFVWSLYRKWDSQSMAAAPVEISWARNALLQLTASKFPVKVILGYVMALDWLMDPSSIRSAARKIIQMDPTNPDLYRLYAVLEYQNGNPDMGAKVFSSAVTLKASLPANPAIGRVALDWACMELVSDTTWTKALPRLCSMIDGQDVSMEVTNTRLLSAKQSLLKSSEVAISLRDAASLSIVSKALVLLAYASEPGSSQPQNDRQGNISAAMDVFWTQFAAISSHSARAPMAEPEDLCSFGASLLALYSSRGPYQRAFLSSHIERCLRAFPHNVFFIELLSHVNASHLLHSAFQVVVQNLLLARPNDCVSTRACIVAHEVRRGTVHSAQAALERSLVPSCDIPTANVGLWLAYISMCCQPGQPKKLSCEAYYRAISRCPWSGELAVRGILGLENVLEESDFQAAFESLANRGLRIHLDLDEYVERVGK